jgi:hypothetical protein
MTIGLTYNDDISRVQIALSDIEDVDVKVEQSTNELFWQTVRGGVSIPISGGIANLDDFEFAADRENFYRVAAVTSGLLLDGTSGNYASTPDHASLDITGDLDLRAEITPDTWVSGDFQTIAAKYLTTGNQRSWFFQVTSTGQLRIFWSPDGTSGVESATTTLFDVPEGGVRRAVRMTLDVSTGDVVFYEADGLAGPWSVIQTVTGSGVTSIFNSTAELEVGFHSSGASSPFIGVVHAMEVRDGINGTEVANPDFATQVMGAGSFTDDAGKLWTINGDAFIAGTESDSITPILSELEPGQAWLKSTRFSSLNRIVRLQDYSDIAIQGSANVSRIVGRSFPSGTTDVSLGSTYNITFNASDLDESKYLSLTLALGDVFYLQFRPDHCVELPPKSLYFIVSEQSMSRPGVMEERRWISTAIIEMARPSPVIVSSTLIWGTVFNLYADWNSLLNANSSWDPLLSTVGSVNDLVVLP